MPKCGFVVLAGRPNAGKSTLLNALVGTKIAIATPRPQTTRFNVRGAIHRPEGQAILVDTPGLFLKISSKLIETVNQRLASAMEDVDVLLHVVDPTRPTGPEEQSVGQLVKKVAKPKILVINKIDAPARPHIDELRALSADYDVVCEVSALRNKGIPHLIDEIFARLPKGEPFFEKGQVTDMSNDQWIAELIREKIYLQTSQEVPYTCTVEVEKVTDRPGKRAGDPPMLHIKANILTAAERYKPMLIGEGGRRIRAVGAEARRELEVAMNRKVFLELHVVVDKHWMERFG